MLRTWQWMALSNSIWKGNLLELCMLSLLWSYFSRMKLNNLKAKGQSAAKKPLRFMETTVGSRFSSMSLKLCLKMLLLMIRAKFQ